MTNTQMIKIYNFLCDYKQEQYNNWGIFRDSQGGTSVKLFINDYSITCIFLYNGADNWDLYINAKVSSDYIYDFLDDSIKCESIQEAKEIIDKMALVLKQMPPIRQIIKSQFLTLYNK